MLIYRISYNCRVNLQVILIIAWGASVCVFDEYLVPYEHRDILFLEEPRTPGFEIVMDLADLSTAICTIVSVWGWASTDLDSPKSRCGPHSWLAAAVSISPFVLRLIQCLCSFYYAPSDDRPRWWLSGKTSNL
ncbi:uncharacterized protein LOC113274130 [Papaver somniferum]|uniref:uncharacterized protein LOC113274130 n=1 Tax=Papaver somniferum TaxID=3469 RepID=UPI000E70585D|nr:uncharacterized protein LOC113274130 [Papaver somniferum]